LQTFEKIGPLTSATIRPVVLKLCYAYH